MRQLTPQATNEHPVILRSAFATKDLKMRGYEMRQLRVLRSFVAKALLRMTLIFDVSQEPDEPTFPEATITGSLKPV